MREKFKPKDKPRSIYGPDYYEFEIIAMNLKSSEQVMFKDTNCFKRYCEGEISLEECFRIFKNNNKIDRVNIKPQLFKRWLASLGWVRE